jgi:hypothetical protein
MKLNLSGLMMVIFLTALSTAFYKVITALAEVIRYI